MYNYQEGIKSKFNGVGGKIEFDRVVNERNMGTLKDVPDKEIIRLVYKLRSCTAEQIIGIIGKEHNLTKNKIEQKIKKLVELRLITRYKLVYNNNGFIRETDNIYMLDINGKNLIEGEDLIKLEWDQKDNLAINTHPEIQLKQLMLNQLILKYFEKSSTFYSYEIKPRLYFKKAEYIRPDAQINFGNEKQQVHFVAYSFRKSPRWKEDLEKVIPHIEKLYKDFSSTENLKQEPIILFVCEDENQIIEMCTRIDKSEIPLSYTIYTSDELINTKLPSNSIAIPRKEANGEFILEYPELPALL